MGFLGGGAFRISGLGCRGFGLRVDESRSRNRRGRGRATGARHPDAENPTRLGYSRRRYLNYQTTAIAAGVLDMKQFGGWAYMLPEKLGDGQGAPMMDEVSTRRRKKSSQSA